jgi:hypothetical protein
MIPEIPASITAIILITNISIAVGVWRLLASAANRIGLAPATRRRLGAGSAVFLGGWLLAALLLAPAPESLRGRDPFYLTPLIPLFALVPALAAGVGLALSPALRQVAGNLSIPATIGLQLYRVVGAVFLVLLAQDRLPAHFALPAGWGDVAIGLAAPLVAFGVARGMRGARGTAIGWNALGLLDLVVAVGMGTGYLAPVLVPGIGTVPPTPAMGVFPLILVPLFAVPVSVLLHLLALSELLRASPITDAAPPMRRSAA